MPSTSGEVCAILGSVGPRLRVNLSIPVPGRPWPEALEEHLSRCRSAIVVLGPAGMGSWQQREHYLSLDRQAKDAAFGVIPVILPKADPALGFLSLNTWVDLSNGVDDAASMDLLAAAVRGESPAELMERTREAAAAICPYRGLEVFREEDAPTDRRHHMGNSDPDSRSTPCRWRIRNYHLTQKEFLVHCPSDVGQ